MRISDWSSDVCASDLSTAKMRRFQPRIAQLKERYGDDKQKFQMAMMELYTQEKINPVGGCLPVLPQMIIFMALYWVLLESVRSEAHTSELQYLMRPSYADFCLKTKNQAKFESQSKI